MSRRSGSGLWLHLTTPFTFGTERRRPNRDVEQDTCYSLIVRYHSLGPRGRGGTW
jgi:hypothetical protein